MFTTANIALRSYLAPMATARGIRIASLVCVAVPGIHCASSHDVDPDQTDCRPWYGAAPDMRPFERQ